MASKKSKINIRHILESPMHITWEEKSQIELTPIQDALKEILPKAKISEETTVSPLQIGEKKLKTSRNRNLHRCDLAIGYQSVLRGLERKELNCVLMSNSVTPVLLLKVALVLADTNSIPVLVIPDLKSITKSTIGFSTMALGFKKSMEEGSIFYPITKLVSENPTVIETPFLKFNETKDHLISEQKSISSLGDRHADVNTKTPKYLFKAKSGMPAFVLNVSGKNQSCTKPEKRKSSDFIAFGEPKNKVQSNTGKNVNQLIEELKMESDESYSDDSDSDESNNGEKGLFFVDNRPDTSLLKKSEKSMGKQPTNLNPSSKKKKSKSKKSKTNQVKPQGQQKTNPNLSSKMKKFKSKKNEENKVKPQSLQQANRNLSSKEKKSKSTQHLSQAISANFQHPKLKAVSSNIKRSKKKNKKHSKPKSS